MWAPLLKRNEWTIWNKVGEKKRRDWTKTGNSVMHVGRYREWSFWDSWKYNEAEIHSGLALKAEVSELWSNIVSYGLLNFCTACSCSFMKKGSSTTDSPPPDFTFHPSPCISTFLFHSRLATSHFSGDFSLRGPTMNKISEWTIWNKVGEKKSRDWTKTGNSVMHVGRYREWSFRYCFRLL